MIQQAPDIGKVILEHTADSKFVELPFGLGEWHLPGPWYIPGTHIDVSPTRHVVLMLLAAVGSSRVDLQACKLEYSIVSPK